MTEEKKIKFEKYLKQRVFIPKIARGLSVYRGVSFEDYVKGKRNSFVHFEQFEIPSNEKNTPLIYMKFNKEYWKQKRYLKNIYRAEYVGNWKQGFYKKTSEFYFSLPWFRTPNPSAQFSLQYSIIKKRMALRRLLYAKSDCCSGTLFYNALLDLFGPNRVLTFVSISFTPYILARMCRSVMCMTFREIIDKYEKDLDWLMEHTQPKSGIIIDRNYNHGQFRGSSGAAKGRKLARECIFQDLFSNERTSKENIKYMNENGLNISYSTYLKYKKEVIDVREPIKELNICC